MNTSFSIRVFSSISRLTSGSYRHQNIVVLSILLMSVAFNLNNAWSQQYLPSEETQLSKQESENKLRLSLNNAILTAIENDDYLTKSEYEQERLIKLSEGSRALPDPTFNIGLLNLPTDGFEFDEEPMTQFKIAATQLFPRGNTLTLTETQFEQAASIQPYRRLDRTAKLAWQTKLLWLDAFKNQSNYAIVQNTKPLFEKLGDIVSANYASSVGNAKQQDIIRADLALIRLKDRLLNLATEKQIALSKLEQFLFSSIQQNSLINEFSSVETSVVANDIADERTLLRLSRLENLNEQSLFTLLNTHPRVVAFEQKILMQSTGIDIAKQSSKPQFGVNASYALRDDAPIGEGGTSRADFFSIGMSVSVPIFSKPRQDAEVSSHILQVEVLKTEKRLLLRELMSGLKSSIAQYKGSAQRLAIYIDQIIPQMTQQTNAALNAYTNDTGEFSQVINAKIDELDAQVTAINIEVSKLKALAAIHYYLASTDTKDTTVSFPISSQD